VCLALGNLLARRKSLSDPNERLIRAARVISEFDRPRASAAIYVCAGRVCENEPVGGEHATQHTNWLRRASRQIGKKSSQLFSWYAPPSRARLMTPHDVLLPIYHVPLPHSLRRAIKINGRSCREWRNLCIFY
jgi:hypothetical protein